MHARSTRILAAIPVMLLCVSAARMAAAADCTVATLQAIAAADTTITGTLAVPAAGALPAYCRVDGYVSTPGNQVNFRLGLPTSWNGKFLFLGGGGFAGSLGSLNAGLTRGYATAVTDTGHQGSGLDATWALNNPAKKIDYGYRGVHVATVATKALTKGNYGMPPRQSYFSGCSNGGRQALMEAQRFPEDFDGIIAGAPALHWTGQEFGWNWSLRAMLQSPEGYVPASKATLLSRAVVQACDAKDGLRDGLIDDPRRCGFDPATLQCQGGDGPDCLTAAQVETVKKIYAGPTNSAGEQLFPGYSPGHEEGTTGWITWFVGSQPPVVGPDGRLAWVAGAPASFPLMEQYFRFIVFDDPTFDWRSVDYDTDPPIVEAISAHNNNATNPDLSRLVGRGGKLLLYHGWGDHALAPLRTVEYYQDVVRTLENKPKTFGNVETADAVRLFMVPGMHHCANGPGPNTFDTLTALEQWVEQGKAPDRIIASHLTSGAVDRTRPLCPYPQVARFDGSGSIDDAANFSCSLEGLDRADEAAGFDHGSAGRDRARGR